MVESSSTQCQVIRCKAAIAWGPNKPLDITEVEVAPPKAGEIRVKVIANALCHTDIYTLDGHDPEGLFPCILGHEATAIVESIGEGVTSVMVGDIVIPCYTPQCNERECVFCQSQKTNLCPKIRAFQGKGVMPDGTTRFSKDGQPIYHFMGCSTFSEYSVIAEISAAKINPNADLNKACLLGCGVSTGWGAAMINPVVKPGSTVAVWGLGAVGLAVVQAAKLQGAKKIYGIDVNEKKFAIANKFGVDECMNPLTQDSKDWLLGKEKWGIDFTYDCTGNVAVMRTALEAAHRGFGECCVIGVAAAGKEIATRPFQLITGRQWKGTAFGGWKSRQDVPKLVNKVILGELKIDDFITH
jgi:Zn-dependent alcohol dehydrogenase